MTLSDLVIGALGPALGLLVGWWATNRPPWKIVHVPLAEKKIQAATWAEINWMLSDWTRTT